MQKKERYKFEEIWECEWWENFKTNEKIKNYARTRFPYKIILTTDSLLAKKRYGFLFGYL